MWEKYNRSDSNCYQSWNGVSGSNTYPLMWMTKAETVHLAKEVGALEAMAGPSVITEVFHLVENVNL